MRAVVFISPGVVEVQDVAEPTLKAPTDAIVKVSRAGLCGSDLHPYRGHELFRSGVVMGHEFVGQVIEIGRDVRSVDVGDRVVSAFSTSCGTCDPCMRGVTARCHRGELFGFGDPIDLRKPALQGAQAEFVRVPFADGTLTPIGPDWSDDDAILLTDNLPTGHVAHLRTARQRDDEVIVIGLGSVGLHALASALVIAQAPVHAVDVVEERRHIAADMGAIVHSPDALFDLSPAPAVIDAAGGAQAQRLAFEFTAAGGTLSTISVPTGARFPWSPTEAYDRNITVVTGRASVLREIRTFAGRSLAPWRPATEAIVTHPGRPIEEAPELYADFAAQRRGIVKATFAF